MDESDIAAVVEVLRSDWLTQGPGVPRFEKAVADRCRAAYGVATSSGTASLHCAALALGLGPGDRLWTSPVTFVASANAGRYCGASVDFVDIDPGTACLSVEALAAKLDSAEREGLLPKVVVPVHFAGQSCDMPRIFELGQRYGFRILEDAAHALGGSYLEEPVGSSRWSDAVSHSFHPVKIITSGEGGMITTNDAGVASRVESLRTHGITRDPLRMEGRGEGPWYYEQLELGFNYRMTDIQAALGASQIERLVRFSERRRELAGLYDELLADLPLRPLARDSRGRSGWHLYVIRLDLSTIGRTRGEVFDSLREAGIGVNVHYIPVHLQPYYTALGFSAGMYPESERYYEECLTLPLFPEMRDEDIHRVREALIAAIDPPTGSA